MTEQAANQENAQPGAEEVAGAEAGAPSEIEQLDESLSEMTSLLTGEDGGGDDDLDFDGMFEEVGKTTAAADPEPATASGPAPESEPVVEAETPVTEQLDEIQAAVAAAIDDAGTEAEDVGEPQPEPEQATPKIPAVTEDSAPEEPDTDAEVDPDAAMAAAAEDLGNSANDAAENPPVAVADDAAEPLEAHEPEADTAEESTDGSVPAPESDTAATTEPHAEAETPGGAETAERPEPASEAEASAGEVEADVPPEVPAETPPGATAEVPAEPALPAADTAGIPVAQVESEPSSEPEAEKSPAESETAETTESVDSPEKATVQEASAKPLARSDSETEAASDSKLEKTPAVQSVAMKMALVFGKIREFAVRFSGPVLARAGEPVAKGIEALAESFTGQSKVVRQSVAWIALWTLFNAAVVWAYIGIFRSDAPTPVEGAGTQITGDSLAPVPLPGGAVPGSVGVIPTGKTP